MRVWMLLGGVALAIGVAGQTRSAPAAPFSVVEATITDMQKAMQAHRVTSHELVQQYLTRIALYDKPINSAITINPHALEDADARDRERAQGHVRGPLHGIPIALKDNIHTVDIRTTGGALAFANFTPPFDATLTKNLRDAGAVIIAKTVLTELANWVSGAPTPMPGNYSAVGGFAFNPYDPRRDPRASSDGGPVMSTGGSSSGAGTAANFWAANVGTDTAGSVVNPASLTMLVGLRPTTGRISRHGIIPITADQDTAGPMARTVTDAAILFGVLESPAPDPDDAATNRCMPPPGRDYTRFLNPNGLRGARIGIPRGYYYDRIAPAGETAAAPTPAPPGGGRGGRGGGGGRGGLNDAQTALMNDAIDVLKRNGAATVDPANMPTVLETDPAKNILSFPICSGLNNAKGKDDACSVVLKYGMKRDFNAYLTSLGEAAPVKTLSDLRAWNTAHARDQIQPGESRYLGRNGRRAGSRAVRSGSRPRPRARRRSGLQGRHRQQQSRRADVPRLGDLESCVAAGLSRDRGADRRHRWRRRRRRRQPVSRGLHAETVTLQRGVRRTAVQRAQAVRDCVRLRAGDEETRAAGTAQQVVT
jgi:amidase